MSERARPQSRTRPGVHTIPAFGHFQAGYLLGEHFGCRRQYTIPRDSLDVHLHAVAHAPPHRPLDAVDGRFERRDHDAGHCGQDRVLHQLQAKAALVRMCSSNFGKRLGECPPRRRQRWWPAKRQARAEPSGHRLGPQKIKLFFAGQKLAFARGNILKPSSLPCASKEITKSKYKAPGLLLPPSSSPHLYP